MRITVIGRKRVVHIATVVLSLGIAAQAQSKSDKPLLWYHPDSKMTAAERGDVKELKDLRRICVSIAPGTTSVAFRRRLEQQVFRELTDYPGLEIVKDPDLAELAILIRIVPDAPLVQSRPMAGSGSPNMALPSTNETYASPTNDVGFYVLTRGGKRDSGGYAPRVIIQLHHNAAEPATSAAVLDLATLIKKLKRLRGEN
jgi:hypothetical protein